MTGLEILGVLALLVIILFISEADLGLALFFTAVLAVILGAASWKGFIVFGRLLEWLVQDPTRTLLLVGGYLICALLYLPLRWYWYNLDEKERCFGKTYHRPSVNDNIDRLARWGLTWPPGLFWNILTQLFGRGFKRLIRKYSYVLDKITDHVFGKEIQDELTKAR